MATSASVYNHQRTNRQVLKRHRKDPPSLILHLNNGHFRFERQVSRSALEAEWCPWQMADRLASSRASSPLTVQLAHSWTASDNNECQWIYSTCSYSLAWLSTKVLYSSGSSASQTNLIL